MRWPANRAVTGARFDTPMAGNNPSSKEVVSLTDSIDREPDERQPSGGQGHITSIEDPEETRLNRVITRPMLTFFILGDILGAGIYSLTGDVAGSVGGAIWASFLLAFLLALVTAFAYLELVTKYPRAAGAALYVHRAFGISLLSFMVTIAVMASGVTSASFAATRVGGDYFTGLFGVENPPMKLIGVAVILLVAAVNYRGVGESIKINIGITAIELSGLLFIILVGAWVLVQGDGNPGQAFEFEGTGFGVLTGITAGAATAFYAFIGFEDLANLAEEAKDVAARFPRERAAWDSVRHMYEIGRAPENAGHPEHALARILAKGFWASLPYLDRKLLADILERSRTPANSTAVDAALQALDTEDFRARLGRIACGYDGGQVYKEDE